MGGVSNSSVMFRVLMQAQQVESVTQVCPNLSSPKILECSQGNLSVRAMDIIVHRDNIVKEGWLSRQSKFVKDWCRRWSALTPQYLCSFKAQGDLRNPTEAIRLRECFTVKSTESVTGKENSFRVDTPDRVFYLIADTSADKEAWIGCVGRQMVRPDVMIQDEYES